MPFNRINQRYGEKHGFPKVIAWDKTVETTCGFNMLQCVFLFKAFVITLSILNPHVLAWYLERSQGAISIVGAEGKRFLSALQFSECQDSVPTLQPRKCPPLTNKPLGLRVSKNRDFSSVKSSLPDFFPYQKEVECPFIWHSIFIHLYTCFTYFIGSFASQRLSKQPR